jgi:hypothetical protein
MALAKVYDTADTIMVPLDIEESEDAVKLLKAVAAATQGIVGGMLLELASKITDARKDAGLDSESERE